MSDDYKLDAMGQRAVSKIETYKISQRKEKDGQEKNTPSTKDTDANSSDTVSISEESVLYTKIMNKALNDENTMERQEKIETLKKQIAEGTYKVDSSKIARNLLKEESQFQL